jgi:salicylate 5-hydroxylase small subunit
MTAHNGAAKILRDLIALNAVYADALDRFDLMQWKTLFTADGVYRAQARENFDRGLPLAAIYLDGHGMMADRVTAIEKTLVFSPRFIRHIVALPLVVNESASSIHARTSFSIFQTLTGASPEILAIGYYDDEIAINEGGLLIRRRTAVYDNALIPNSLVYPL